MNKLESESICITNLTEIEENKLDNGGVKIKRDDFVFDIQSKDVICYGEIDFSTGSDDFNILCQMHWLDHLITRGIDIPSNYDYETNSLILKNNKVLYYDSTNCAYVAQYFHGRLGKPNKSCIFKHKFKTNVRRAGTI